MKITNLSVDRVERIRAVQADVDPTSKEAVFVVGKNDEGKSSTLNSIQYALSGGRIPKDVIHRGEDHGEVKIGTDTGMTVRKVMATSLTVHIMWRVNFPWNLSRGNIT